ncbi:MAG: ribonuclease H-like domain-containing protein [Chloroflexota bacterium]
MSIKNYDLLFIAVSVNAVCVYNSNMPSLSDKLKALGVKVGTSEISLPVLPKSSGIASSTLDGVSGGRWISTHRGDTFVVEYVYPLNYLHGMVPIQINAPLSVLSTWARDERIANLSLSEIAFLDTETSGLSGGTGTYAFMVGVGRFIDTEFKLSIFFMRDPSEEPALLEALANYLAPCSGLVTFNGKAFDAPLLRTRYQINAIPCPFDGFSHIDLLPLARRLWRDRLPSRALKYLEEHIMVAPRTSEEVPGFEIPWLYFDYLRNGDITPLKGVFYHNSMDVVAMAALLSLVTKMLSNPHGVEIEHGQDVIALGKLFEDLNLWEDAALLYERGLKTPLPEEDFWQAVKRLSTLQRRRGDIDTAVQLWRQAAAEGHIYAHIELAKYYEHSRRDIPAAQEWTQSALKHLETVKLPKYIYNHWLDELTHRLERLEGKAKKIYK